MDPWPRNMNTADQQAHWPSMPHAPGWGDEADPGEKTLSERGNQRLGVKDSLCEVPRLRGIKDRNYHWKNLLLCSLRGWLFRQGCLKPLRHKCLLHRWTSSKAPKTQLQAQVFNDIVIHWLDFRMQTPFCPHPTDKLAQPWHNPPRVQAVA